MTTDSQVLEKIKELLIKNNVTFELLEHEAVYTSEDAAKIRDTGLSNGAKALICFADKTAILIVVPGNKKVDFKKFKTVFGIKDLSMATKEKVMELTGLEIGAIPPIGSVMSLKTYFDTEFKNKDLVAFNAGSHTVSVRMSAKDLIHIENPLFGDYSIEKN